MEVSREVRSGIAWFEARGECTLVEAVELVRLAITWCREQAISKLLFDGRGFVGVPVPNLVDRFLMVEDWAAAASGMVLVVLVVRPEYIHPQKFGVKVAATFGLTADVHTSEIDAVAWLTGLGDRA
jgi:hypothetical protein